MGKTRAKEERLRTRFGHRLRELRRRRALSLEALGERAKVDAKYLQRVETAKQAATVDTIEKLAAALGTQAVDLFTFSEEAAVTTRERIAHLLGIVGDEDLRKIAKVVEAMIG